MCQSGVGWINIIPPLFVFGRVTCAVCATDMKGPSVLTWCLCVSWEQFAILSHINQPLWHFYTPLSLFKKFSSWPLYTNMVTKTYGLTAGELFFGLIVNWIVIHYPLCVNASPLSRCLITYLSHTLWSHLAGWKTSQQCDQCVKKCVSCDLKSCCGSVMTETVVNFYQSSAFCHLWVTLFWLCVSVWVGARRGGYRQYGLCFCRCKCF